jgi:hypothetical protein
VKGLVELDRQTEMVLMAVQWIWVLSWLLLGTTEPRFLGSFIDANHHVFQRIIPDVSDCPGNHTKLMDWIEHSINIALHVPQYKTHSITLQIAEIEEGFVLVVWN